MLTSTCGRPRWTRCRSCRCRRSDPFSGVIVTGWGRVNGASPAYRATVYITGAALDARSLRVAMFRQSGSGSVPVSDEVARQVEDAILTRARQLRIAAGN